MSAFAELKAVRELLNAHEQREAQLKQTLQQAMGEASRAIFEGGSITWKKAKDSLGLDLKRMLQDHPELQQQYALTKPGSRRFLIT